DAQYGFGGKVDHDGRRSHRVHRSTVVAGYLGGFLCVLGWCRSGRSVPRGMPVAVAAAVVGVTAAAAVVGVTAATTIVINAATRVVTAAPVAVTAAMMPAAVATAATTPAASISVVASRRSRYRVNTRSRRSIAERHHENNTVHFKSSC